MVVASAGGLNAIVRVLRDLSADLQVPVVVAQHPGGQGSQFVSLLAQRVAWPVVWAEEGAPLQPG